MKKKKLQKTLSLNKMTVTNLTDQQQLNAKGGNMESGSCGETCVGYCDKTGNCPDMPSPPNLSLPICS